MKWAPKHERKNLKHAYIHTLPKNTVAMDMRGMEFELYNRLALAGFAVIALNRMSGSKYLCYSRIARARPSEHPAGS